MRQPRATMPINQAPFTLTTKTLFAHENATDTAFTAHADAIALRNDFAVGVHLSPHLLDMRGAIRHRGLE